jgi:hypothetical protein
MNWCVDGRVQERVGVSETQRRPLGRSHALPRASGRATRPPIGLVDCRPRGGGAIDDPKTETTI